MRLLLICAVLAACSREEASVPDGGAEPPTAPGPAHDIGPGPSDEKDARPAAPAADTRPAASADGSAAPAPLELAAASDPSWTAAGRRGGLFGGGGWLVGWAEGELVVVKDGRRLLDERRRLERGSEDDPRACQRELVAASVSPGRLHLSLGGGGPRCAPSVYDVALPGDDATRIVVGRSPVGAPPLSVFGLPGASADGMHVAALLGDPEAGPLGVRIARIDGELVLDETLLRAGEGLARAGESPNERNQRVARLLEARVAPVQRALAAAEVRPLAALSPGLGLVREKDRMTARLPGFASQPVAAEALDRALVKCRGQETHDREGHACAPRACLMRHTLAAVFAEPEHGLVVAHLTYLPTADCPSPPPEGAPFYPDDWRVFALTPLP